MTRTGRSPVRPQEGGGGQPPTTLPKALRGPWTPGALPSSRSRSWPPQARRGSRPSIDSHAYECQLPVCWFPPNLHQNGVRADQLLIRPVEEGDDVLMCFPGLGPRQWSPVCIGEGVLFVRALEQVHAEELDEHITVCREAICLAVVTLDMAGIANHVDLVTNFCHIVVKRLKQSRRDKRRDHGQIDKSL